MLPSVPQQQAPVQTAHQPNPALQRVLHTGSKEMSLPGQPLTPVKPAVTQSGQLRPGILHTSGQGVIPRFQSQQCSTAMEHGPTRLKVPEGGAAAPSPGYFTMPSVPRQYLQQPGKEKSTAPPMILMPSQSGRQVLLDFYVRNVGNIIML